MEIGSEFSGVLDQLKQNTKAEWLPYGSDYAFVFSGRTAIETVLKDICCKKRKALLPSYCCASMIEPFANAGYEIEFYEVTMIDHFKITLHISQDCGVLLWCNYFGYDNVFPMEEICAFQAHGGIVIEDITHSLLSRQQFHGNSDYLVASLRKWGALLSGGFCSKTTGFFAHKPQIGPEQTFLNQKKEAMDLKEEYLHDHIADKKKRYLHLFSESNQYIEDHYSDVAMDEISRNLIDAWNVEEIQSIRKRNAEVLYKGLESCEYVQPLFPFEQMDCPLFVPVCIESGMRDSLRKVLIQEEIYCPIHWPQPNVVCQSHLYEMELSLICDQRYNEKDMQRICQIITNFFHGL